MPTPRESRWHPRDPVPTSAYKVPQILIAARHDLKPILYEPDALAQLGFRDMQGR
jgi:hypothetical protein